MKWEILPPLGQLPLLKTLHLIQLPALREVPIVYSENWNSSDKHLLFPCLEELVIRDCPEMREFPSSQCSSEVESMHWFGCLRHATIYNCPQLMHLPPFSQMQYLSTVSIEGVGSFPCIRLLVRTLYVKGCAGLRTLDEILLLTQCSLSVLEKLTIESCPDLAYLPWESFSKLVSLEKLVIVDCPKLSSPSTDCQDEKKCVLPPSLKVLVIRASDMSGKQLSQLLLQLPFLHRLTIGKCPQITSLAVGTLIAKNASSSTSDHHRTTDGLLQIPPHLLTRLWELYIDDCSDLVLLCKEDFAGLISLRTLHITGCPQLLSSMGLEEEEQANGSCFLLPPSLQDLMVSHMNKKLQSCLLSNVSSLSILVISRSPELTSLVLHPCTSLETLIIEKCSGLASLEGVESLSHLKHLRVFECPGLATPWNTASAEGQTVTLDFSLPLEKLEIDGILFFTTTICKKLNSLQHLVFFMAKKVRAFTEEQEKALYHVTSLQALDFCYCPDLLSLPKELHCFPSLMKLTIKACPGIRSLPEKVLPTSLQELYVSNCSAELKEQCQMTKSVRTVYVDRHASKFMTICKLLRLYVRKRKI